MPSVTKISEEAASKLGRRENNQWRSQWNNQLMCRSNANWQSMAKAGCENEKPYWNMKAAIEMKMKWENGGKEEN